MEKIQEINSNITTIDGQFKHVRADVADVLKTYREVVSRVKGVSDQLWSALGGLEAVSGSERVKKQKQEQVDRANHLLDELEKIKAELDLPLEKTFGVKPTSSTLRPRS
mmetsp:Transcript_1510/g.2303  ORF Transcript_1510/g.2303 Transcript_1510/m.2303 type:complete len:109 (-) Transcript_1510:19-345(-)